MNKTGDLQKRVYGMVRKAKEPRFFVPLIIILGLVLFPFFNPAAYILTFLIAIFMYCALCVSWNIIGGYTGYLSFGHATFFGLGVYVSALLYRSYGLPLYCTAILGGLISSGFAMAIGFPALRIRGAYFCVLTFAMVPAIRTVFFNLTEFTGGAAGIYVKSPCSTGTYYLIFLSLAILATIMAIVIERSKFGIGLSSIREDEDAAEVMGVNTTKMKIMAFGLSAFFPGIVGGIYPFYKLYINPAIAFTEDMAILIVLFCFFGGKRWWLGPIIGASILTAVSRVLRIHAGGIIGLLRLETMFPHISSGILAGFIYGLVLILVIIFMPGGILSQLDKWLVKKS